MTGFSPVATLAGKQLLTVWSFEQIAPQFPPYFKSPHPYKSKKTYQKVCPFRLVRMTGFSPVATLAGKQLSTVWSFGQIAPQFPPYFKSPHLYKSKKTYQKVCPFRLVRMTGFSPVATLAGKQLLTVWSFGQIAPQFPPYFKSPHPYKSKKAYQKVRPFRLVRMTGFEPTRLATLEPETSASAVPPHPQKHYNNTTKP